MSNILLLALATAASSVTGTDPARLAPEPHCLDARQVSGMYQSDEHSVVVASGQSYYRLQMASSCPGLTQDPALTLVAPQGWACGRANESFIGSQLRCPISKVEQIDSRQYALVARQADRSPATNTIEAVQVSALAGTNRARRYAHGLTGTADYCFNPTQMRSWSETPAGIQVQVSPRGNAGNSTYMVELVGHCTVLNSSPALLFRSGLDTGAICGNTGDRVIALRDTFIDGTQPARAYTGMIPANAIGAGAGSAVAGQCMIAAVYPIHS